MFGIVMRKRLRQDDETHHLRISQADRLRAFVLALRDRREAGAHHLRHIGRGEQRDTDQRAHQLVRRILLRHEQRQHHARHEQHGDQRHAAHELDEHDRQRSHDRHFRAAPERQQHAERQRDNDADGARPRWSPARRPTARCRRGQARSADQPLSRRYEQIGSDDEEIDRAEVAPRRVEPQHPADADRQQREEDIDAPALAGSDKSRR